MYVDKISLIAVITVVNGAIGEIDTISISDDKVSWEEAVGSNHTLLSSDFVLRHGWNFIPSYIPNISSGSRYWIGARANLSPFVSWEGCVQWIGGQDCGDLFPGGSIGDCIQNCSADLHYFILQDSHCRCVSKNSSNCFRYTYNRCNKSCPNNPNDWCGGSGDTMSLYYTGPYNYTITETNDDSERNCAVLFYIKSNLTNDSIQFKPKNCRDNHTRRYICKNDSSASTIDNTLSLGWLEAVEQCRVKQSRLHYVSLEEIKGSVFWTSLRRSFRLKWTNKNGQDDDFPFCVSLSVDNSAVSLHEEPCDRDHRYIYLDDDQIWWRWWYLLLLLPIAGLLVIICRVFLSRKSSKDSKSPGKPVQEKPVASEHINNTVEERPNASAARHMYHKLEIVDTDGKTANDDHGVKNANEMSIYNTTFDSRNRGGVPRLFSDPGSVYNTTISRGAVGIVQNNIYNTTLCRDFVRSMPRDYVSCNVYGSVRNKDTDHYDNASTLLPEMADPKDTDAYEDVRC